MKDTDAATLDASVWWPILSPHWLRSRGPSKTPRREPEKDRAVEATILRLLRGLTFSGLTALEFPLSERPSGVPDISQRVETIEEALWLADRADDPQAGRLLRRWAEARRAGRDFQSSALMGADLKNQDEAGKLLSRVPSLWLEYDLRRQTRPAPLLCLRLPPDCGDLEPWVDAAFVSRPDDGWRKTFGRCLEALPLGSRPLYLFDLGAREPGLLRLEIFGIPVEEVAAYLSRIGCPVPAHMEMATTCFSETERPHVSFDISPQGVLSDRVGLEVSFQRLPSRESGWHRLFERLCAQGLCRHEAAEVFFAWQGQDRPRTAGELWPSHPRLKRGHLVRVGSHVKLVLSAGKPPRAKGYILFQYLSPTS